jgi:peptidoglycan LD-endopeptidase LytH
MMRAGRRCRRFATAALAVALWMGCGAAWSKPAAVTAAEKEAAVRMLGQKVLTFPVKGYDHALRDNFDERRGSAPHDALDIMAPRGTPVVAVDEGTVAKLFKSAAGGLTIYEFDASGTIAYYYAHLDRYAPGLREGAKVKRGQLLGYVGSSGNARADAPHLHFTAFALGAGREWWKGVAINPYAALAPR